MKRLHEMALPHLRRWQARLSEHSKRNRHHWLTVGILIVVGLYAGHWLEETALPLWLRYRVFQAFNLNPQVDSRSDDVAIVMIGDREYWTRDTVGRPLARRSPLNRYYLAELIDKVAAARPLLIALDVDLRAQVPTRFGFEDPAYEDEDECLAESMRAAQETIGHRVVIPRAISHKFDEDVYLHERDAFDVYEPAYVSRGYIFAHPDVRRIPMPVIDATGLHVDSLAFAILRELGGAALEDAKKNARDNILYGKFRGPGFFLTIPAAAVMRGDRDALQNIRDKKAVLIGGSWHNQAFDRGGLIDMHDSPAGKIPGVLIHANYLQAMIRKDTFGGLHPAVAGLVDVSLSLVAALLFVIAVHRMRAIVLLTLAAIVASLLLSRMGGIYFDFVIPIVFLGGHVAFEQISEWHEDATEHREICLGGMEASS